MKISVIIPVYNAAATLARCLDSLAAQTFRDFALRTLKDHLAFLWARKRKTD